MLTKKQIDHFTKVLEQQKQELTEKLTQTQSARQDSSEREAVGELSSYDNHPGDLGTELFDREKDFALEQHVKDELQQTKDSLIAIKEGTYGTCKQCGTAIPYERLEIVPFTLYCVDHSTRKLIKDDRPNEEDILEPPINQSFERGKREEVVDYQDSFQEVARFGTSETPSDFTQDTEDYDKLYTQEDEVEGFTEQYETFVGNDISGNHGKGHAHSKELDKYEQILEDNQIESTLGDIPYHEKDSYLEDEEKDKS